MIYSHQLPVISVLFSTYCGWEGVSLFPHQIQPAPKDPRQIYDTTYRIRQAHLKVIANPLLFV